MALLAVPNSTPLVDRIMTNNALLGALCQGINQEHTLFSQVLELIQEVLRVILYLGSVLSIPLCILFFIALYISYLFLVFR
jgi:hypothetical protein